MFCCTHSHFIASSRPPAMWGRAPSPVPPSEARQPSSHLRQGPAQLLGRTEQRVLGGFFGRVQHFTNSPQLESLIMLQLKHHAFARGQPIERLRNSAAQLPSHEIALGIGSAATVGHLREKVILFAFGIRRYRSVFFAYLLLANVIEAQVRNNPINPGVKRALEPEPPNVLVCLQERFLVNVLGLMLRASQMQR